ncbi:reverse transcriptase domain-containing protein [Tanacetum coccineum]
MTTPIEKRNANKFCEFHGEIGHNTDECMYLRKQIEEMPKAGKLSHLIKEIKQNNRKEQPKPWERVAIQRITQSFSPNSEISFPPLGEDEGTEGLMIIEAEIGGHCVHRIYVDSGSASEILSRNAEDPGRRRGNYFKKQQMPFGMRNAGGTYQRLVDKAFHKQTGRNLEVYVDDLVIKSHTEDEIVRDMEETFQTLREINMKLNPKKCTFGIEEGMFLGYKVSTRGLKVCPDKVDVVLSLPSPKCLKDMQKLNEKLASLNRFLAKSVEKSLPLFKTLKKCTRKIDFYWTTEAEEAFRQMKQLIAKLPMLVAPMEKKELIVYLAAAKETVSAVLMTEREAKQMPIYFVCRALRGPEVNYTSMEKLVLALVHASKRLKSRTTVATRTLKAATKVLDQEQQSPLLRDVITKGHPREEHRSC